MIVRLAGRLLEKQPNHVVLDVHGVGYQAWLGQEGGDNGSDPGFVANIIQKSLAW